MKITRRNALLGSALACLLPIPKAGDAVRRGPLVCTRVALPIEFYERFEGFSEYEYSEVWIERAPGATGTFYTAWS